MNDLDAKIAALDARWLAAGTNVAQSLNGYVKAFHAADDALRDALALCHQLAAERAADAWQPIDTCPRVEDVYFVLFLGKPMLLYRYVDSDDPDDDSWNVGVKPTHWIPIPPLPPSITSAGGTTDE